MKTYKLYGYIDLDMGKQHNSYVCPKDINFKTELTQRLHAETEPYIVKGELQKIVYYSDITIESDGSHIYSNPIVEETFDYTRTAVGFVTHRTQTISWYLEDDTLSPETKTRVKYYSAQEAIGEGKRRRGNIISRLTMVVFGLLKATTTDSDSNIIMTGQALVDGYATDINAFIMSGSNGILATVTNDTRSWMNNPVDTNGTTIRDVILSELNIWS